MPTAYSGSGFLERLDYIFYTPKNPLSLKEEEFQLQCVSSQQDPNTLGGLWKNLIKHKNEITYNNEKVLKNYTDFPSDHAILLAKFRIEDMMSKKIELEKKFYEYKDSDEDEDEKDNVVDELARKFFSLSN